MSLYPDAETSKEKEEHLACGANDKTNTHAQPDPTLSGHLFDLTSTRLARIAFPEKVCCSPSHHSTKDSTARA